MKNKLLSDEKLKQYINALTESIFRAKKKNGDCYTWTLFFDELFESEKQNGVYDTGAIALAISALCNSDLKNGAYKEAIEKARELLIDLRNKNGAWSALADKSDLENTGIIYNTVNAIEAVIDSGFLNADIARGKIVDNFKFVFESLGWIYKQKIQKDEVIGWGYSGETSKKIYIMPTVNVLLIMKKFYFCVLSSMPSMLEELKIEDLSLVQIINKIYDSLYQFRISTDGGWGKDIEERTERVVYTLYCIYGLSYMIENCNNDLKHMSKEDVEYFSKLICRWDKEKKFDIREIDSLMPEEYFDTYIQNMSEGNTSNVIIDHESFFESIAINVIIEFVKAYKKDIPKSRHSSLFDVIAKLNRSLISRICEINVNNENFTVVRSRRGLLSQSYPIYTITQATDALTSIRLNKGELVKLLKYKEILIKIVGVIIQIFTLCIINSFAIPNISKFTLLVVSTIAPLSEYLKNWIFKLSKIEE